LRAGEILGLAGLVGAGRTELVLAAFGIDPRAGGEVKLNGVALAENDVAGSIAAGLCLVPEDRKEQGLFLDFAISHNISLPNLPRLSRAGFVDRQAEMALAEQSQQRLAIKVASLSRPVAELSGGNQQKVVIGKWLEVEPNLILLDDPTRGVDVGAKREIYLLIRQMGSEGKIVLFSSTELSELVGLCDRIIVIYRGQVAGELAGDTIDEQNVLHMVNTGAKLARAEQS
jgi:ribose transport system ATP-binding protein